MRLHSQRGLHTSCLVELPPPVVQFDNVLCHSLLHSLSCGTSPQGSKKTVGLRDIHSWFEQSWPRNFQSYHALQELVFEVTYLGSLALPVPEYGAFVSFSFLVYRCNPVRP